jgi:N-acetylglucosaminyl-diphospho-decaprenol L-rhamnosyltransferase
MHDLDIVIVTWNSANDIGRCLQSILESGSERSVRVTVVDNGSEDGTGDLVQDSFPGVRLLRNHENRGFAAANNQALSTCTAPYWMLLNPDTELTPGSTDRLLAFMEEEHRASAAGPVLVNADGTPQFPGRNFPSLSSLLWETLFLDRLFPRSPIFGAHRGMRRTAEVPERVDFVHGAALLLRRTVAEEVGLLDEGFFMYFEEVDWCYRIREHGGQCWVLPSSRIIHHGGVDLGHYDANRLLHYHRSLLRFAAKHYGSARQLLLRPLIGLRALIRLGVWSITFLVRPQLRRVALSSLKGYAEILRHLAVGW